MKNKMQDKCIKIPVKEYIALKRLAKIQRRTIRAMIALCIELFIANNGGEENGRLE
jgi:hypothetical protein